MCKWKQFRTKKKLLQEKKASSDTDRQLQSGRGAGLYLEQYDRRSKKNLKQTKHWFFFVIISWYILFFPRR